MPNRIWFTSDTHFSHYNIIQFCNRPYENVHDMNIELMMNWNEMISPEDIVYHLGDYSFFPVMRPEYLNGTIILIQGNHDRFKPKRYFEDRVFKNIDRRIGKYNCILSHKPIDLVEYNEENKTSYQFCICGHVHEKWKINNRCINVGVDVWGYKPISEELLIELLDEL